MNRTKVWKYYDNLLFDNNQPIEVAHTFIHSLTLPIIHLATVNLIESHNIA